MEELKKKLAAIEDDAIRKRKKECRIETVICYVYLSIGLLLLIFGVIGAFMTPMPPKMSEIPVGTLELTESYELDDVTVLGVYAYVDEYYEPVIGFRKRINSLQYGELPPVDEYSDPQWHVLVRFTDGNGQTCYAKAQIDGYSDFDKACREYILQSGNAGAGLPLKGCFKAYAFSESQKGYDAYEALYRTYQAEIPGELLSWSFTYEWESAAACHAKAMLLPKMFLCIAGMILLSGLGCLMYVRRIRKRLDQPAAQAMTDAQTITAQMESRAHMAWWVRFAAIVMLGILIVMFVAARFGVKFPPVLIFPMLLLFTVSGIAYFAWARRILAFRRLLAEENLDQAAIARELEDAVVVSDSIRCGRQVLLLPGNHAVPLSRLKWVWCAVYKNKFGVETGYSMRICTRECKKISYPLKHIEEGYAVIALLDTLTERLPQGLLLGMNQLNREAYKAYCAAWRKEKAK